MLRRMRASIRSFWTMGFVVSSAFVLAATGCSDDDDDDNGGNAGTGGSSSGSGGKAGMSAGGATGGKAGSPSGGKAGSNQAGEAGTPDPGGGGAAGEPPIGGAAGEPGGGAAGEGIGGTGEGGAGGAPVALDCAQYCDWVQASCSGVNAQYPADPNDEQCLQSCAAFPTTAGDNSFACRVGFAAQVSTSATNCDAAGPAGIGECGTPCEAYCNLMLTYCPHEADGATLNACMAECATVPANNITTFVYPAPGGDTLACRIAHATNAAKDTDPNGVARLLHCNHAAGDEAPCLDATP
jgi:hypothetical protein